MTKGLKQSVCDQSFYNGPVSKFWAYAFVLSKAPELGELSSLFPFPLPLFAATYPQYFLKMNKETNSLQVLLCWLQESDNEFEVLTDLYFLFFPLSFHFNSFASCVLTAT
jgi:hypothetical protein